MLKKKIFKPRFPQIKRQESYETDAGRDFWADFPTNLSEEVKAEFSHKELKKLATELGSKNMARIGEVAGYLERGADIGCRGIYRTATFSKNAASAYEAGPEVTDAIAGWIVDGYAYGPVEEWEVPAEAKVSGIMVRKNQMGRQGLSSTCRPRKECR